jgi:hypothetical protein
MSFIGLTFPIFGSAGDVLLLEVSGMFQIN